MNGLFIQYRCYAQKKSSEYQIDAWGGFVCVLILNEKPYL